MYCFSPYNFSRPLATLVCVFAVTVGVGIGAPTATYAQTSDDQTYNCGAYGAGDYGGMDCVTAAETTPTPPPAPTPTPTPASSGLFPDTGGSLGVWAAFGALLLAFGLGVYGSSRRRASRAC